MWEVVLIIIHTTFTKDFTTMQIILKEDDRTEQRDFNYGFAII